MTFHVGQRVECIDDGLIIFKKDIADGTVILLSQPDGLVKGQVYVVTKANYTYHRDEFEIECIDVDRPGKHDMAERFRAITDISVFTEMLTKAPTPEKEDVS